MRDFENLFGRSTFGREPSKGSGNGSGNGSGVGSARITTVDISENELQSELVSSPFF